MKKEACCPQTSGDVVKHFPNTTTDLSRLAQTKECLNTGDTGWSTNHLLATQKTRIDLIDEALQKFDK